MTPYATFRRHPLGEVVARTNEDRHPAEVVPFGKFGAGGWTGHPIGLFIVVGILLMGLIGIPPLRLLILVTIPVGSLVGYLLWRCHRTALDRRA
jgi:hypothetical protein